MDCSPPGSFVHGILQARILEWVAISFSRGSSWPRDRTQVSCTAGRFFTNWATISPSNEYSGLIFFRIDWFHLLVAQGTLKSLLQHQSSKASILWHLAFFMVQFSHMYMTTGKTISLTICTFVGKVMCLLFNMLSMFVMVFLPRGHHLLILWLQLASTVILEPKKIKSVTGSTFSSSICHEVMGPDVMILVFWMLGLKPVFSLSSFTLIKGLFSSFSLCAFRVTAHIWGYFSQQSWFQLVIDPAWHFTWCALHRS